MAVKKNITLPREFNLWFGLKPKTIAIILAIVLGGGGGSIAALDFCTESDVKGYIKQYADIDNQRHEVVDKKFQKQDEKIEKIGAGVNQVQTTQIREIARQSARRLTAEIKKRTEREAEYDRLLYKNIRRLENGKDPCATVICDE